MYINKIDIENYKAISKMKLKLTEGINLLIGDNGVGKTSILEALVVALGGFLNGVNGVSAKNILLSDVKMQTLDVGSVSTSIRYNTPVKITCELQEGEETYAWEKIREDESPKRNTKLVKVKGDIVKYALNLTNDISSDLPILSYQSSVRTTQTKNGGLGTDINVKMGDRRCGYMGCLDSVSNLKQIKEWCYEMERIAFEQNGKVGEYEQFKGIVGLFMQKMSETSEIPQIYYSRQHKDMVYCENKEIVSISCLSAGYQSVLWMIMDIAYRLAVLNPSKSDIMNSEGIVLIDEVDMHLHPKWQWNIIYALRTTLPNVQFIIATHSPIIISSCKKGNLILIDDNQEVTYLKNAYGYSVNDVLELCQGSTDVLNSIKSMKNLFDVAIDNNDLDRASAILKNMSEEFGNDNTEVLKAKTELDMEVLLREGN
jgi:predicted ATP-binding protein involved in virulence